MSGPGPGPMSEAEFTSNNTATGPSFAPVENPWRIKHPVVTFFHLLFRTLALIVYLLCGWSSDRSFIESFIAIILLLSLDFWTVKNITGRIMAGLRWWNYVNDEGQSVWNFESSSPEDQVKFSRAEIQIFWTGLIVFPVIWTILLFSAIIHFSFAWVVLVLISLTLLGSNLGGYLRCRMGSSMAGAANTYIQQQVKSNIFNFFKSNKNQEQPQNTNFGA